MARNWYGKKIDSGESSKGTAAQQQGRLKQLLAVWRMTRKGDPAAKWWMLGVALAVIVVMVGLGILVGHMYYFAALSVPLAFMAALLMMARRAETVAYASIAGQPGASLAPLQNLRKGWNVEQEPIAVDQRTQDLVFRAVGRCGIVLITEGPTARVSKLAESERKRHARLLANVPIHIVHSGSDEGQVPLKRMGTTLMKLKRTLTDAEVTEVSKRLRALGGVKLAMPKGIDPSRMRPDRKAARGR